MSIDLLTARFDPSAFTAPAALVCVGPGVGPEGLGEVVSTFVCELWSRVDENDWADWFADADPAVEVAHDPDEDDPVRVYGPGDPDAPAPSDFDLPPTALRQVSAPGSRTFHVRSASSSQMLTEALQQAVDLLLSYAEDDPDVIEDWVAVGAPCRVVQV